MKKIITLVMLFACLGVFAQKGVARKVTELVSQNADFKSVSVLSVSQGIENSQTRTVVEKATYAKLDFQALTNLMTAKNEYIELAVPYLGETIAVQLFKVNPFSEGFHVDTDKAINISYEQGLYYRGIIKGDLNSVASFNFFKGECNGIISGKNVNNLTVAKLDKPGNQSDYIIFSDSDLKIANTAGCYTKDVKTAQREKTNRSAAGGLAKCVTMYFEIDHDLYQQNDSNTTTTTNWVTSVFNNVQTLYANDDILISLKSTYIWTTEDPYDGNVAGGSDSSQDYLYQFNDLRPAFDGDLGQLLGIDPGGLGGVAVGTQGLCTQNNFCYSDVNFSYSTVPTFSWTVMVITHEFGHLMGSPHTHACVWNGNNTSIDNCAPFALGQDWEGGECITDPPTIPSTTVKGTIMSYCHLVGGVGINFNNGFGPQPKQAIIDAMNGSNCLSTDCINTCINAVTNIQVAVTGTSATVTWDELSNAGSWQVSVRPFSSNTPVWTTVNAATYTTTTPLLPNTFYRVWVRPICDNELTAPNDRKVFVTGADWCDGITIADSGGANNGYVNNESYVRTIIPNLPNKKIELTFTAFDMEVDYDYVYVYDGNSTAATDLSAGGFDGTDIPGPFVSTAADGSLTIRFFSDAGVTNEGFVANVACQNLLGTQDFTPNIDFTYYPNPTNGQVTISSKTPMSGVTVYNVAGQLLYQGNINGLDTKVDISAFASGTYFFKLRFDDREANFKIQKM